MQVIVTSDVDDYAAEYTLARWNDFRVLGLATGSTPETLYGWWVQFHFDGKLSFCDKTTFNLDEYYGLPPNHPQSYRATMQRLLMQYVDLPRERFHVPPGLSRDIDADCAAYEAKIVEAGGIDLQILGIGTDGHIAFNEPGSPRDSRTRKTLLHAGTIQNNARFFDNDLNLVPREAVTVGIATILDAREILLLAKGKSKAVAVAESLLGRETPQVPASFLQSHPNCSFILDGAAARELLRDFPRDADSFVSANGRRHTLRLLD